MSDTTNDGVDQIDPNIPTEVSDNDEVINPSDEISGDQDPDASEPSRRKKKEDARQQEKEALEKRLKQLEGTVQPFLQKKVLESSMKELGVSSIDQTNFEKERDDLVAQGLTLENATNTALRLQASTIKVKEEETRTKGRKETQLPPSSTQPHDKVVTTEAEMYALKGQAFKDVYSKVQSGEMKLAG